MPYGTNRKAGLMSHMRGSMTGFLVAWVVAASANANDLSAILSSKIPRPDSVLSAIDSDVVPTRRFAAAGLGKWHQHVPGAIVCLRRLVNDENSSVAVAAIVAASHIGSRDAFAAIVESLDKEWSDAQVSSIADAMDGRAFRAYWKWSDEFHVRDRVQRLIQRRSQAYTAKTIGDLEYPEPTRKVIESGREVFIAAGCVACHQVNGYGQNTSGVNLSGIGQCYSNPDLAKQVLFPSLDIHDAGIQERFVTVDGQVIVGQVRQNQNQQVGIQTDPAIPDSLVWLDHDEIEHRSISPVSAMPTGLLSGLTPTQVADLVVFLRTDGGLLPMPSGSHQDH